MKSFLTVFRNLGVFGFQLRDTRMTAGSERVHRRLPGDPDGHF
ncbi:hypothetical protein ABZ619_42760 [Streptomyces sp. NPDC007851]